MSELTPRQRVLKALSHEESDRVPVDLNGTYASGILTSAYTSLKAYLHIGGVAEEATGHSSTAVVEEEVLRRFQIDTRKVVVRIPDLRMYWNSDGTQTDGWGAMWGKPEDGNWYVTRSPFAGEPTISDVERYSFPDPDDEKITEGLLDEVLDLRNNSDFAICLNLPSRLVHQIQFLRGYAESLMDLLINRPFIEALMDRITDINVQIARNVLTLVGDMIDIICIGDDLGTQSGPVVSLDTYRDLIKPRQKRLLETIKSHTQAKVFYHSCGSVYAFLPDLIDIGVDALNPVQVSAKDMEPQQLKREFGKDLTFWGGIDTQRVLPFGTPQDVEEEVKRRFAELGPGGGWVCAAVHNIQPGVPPENICAIFDTAREYCRYT